MENIAFDTDISISKLENEIRINFDVWFQNLQEVFEKNKKDYYTEFERSYKAHTDKNNLQKKVLTTLTVIIKILSPLIQNFKSKS